MGDHTGEFIHDHEILFSISKAVNIAIKPKAMATIPVVDFILTSLKSWYGNLH
jgi:hypothetical protein